MKSIYELGKSNLYMKTLLSQNYIEKNIWLFLNIDYLEFTREEEGILYIQQVISTLSQNEKKINGTYVRVIKKRTHNYLSAESIYFINLEQWKRYESYYFQF